MTSEVSRRDFLKASAAGAGFVLTFRIAGGAMSAAEAAGAWEPNTVFTIDPSGIITVHITKAEMGQGVGTALAQIVADELEADWRDLLVGQPTHDREYGRLPTRGGCSLDLA